MKNELKDLKGYDFGNNVQDVKTEIKAKVTGITEEDIRSARETLKIYKEGKQNLENRVVENEQWYKMRHWEYIRRNDKKDYKTNPEPASAWLFNVIMNKHADCMDSYPEPCVLPRAENDKGDAEKLSAILPVILEQQNYKKTFSNNLYPKLKHGTCCYGVFWDNRLEYGLGDISIKAIDLLNIFWEPGIKDIQDSRNLFTIELMDIDVLTEKYPELSNKIHADGGMDVTQYIYDDTVDTSNKVMVIDWYYKKYDGTKEILHYVKFVGDEIIYASENDEEYLETGYYEHGKYPFVFDTLFIEEGTPAGFGFIDVAKDCQMYIDKLKQIVLKNAFMAGNPRWLYKEDCGINEDEFADWGRQIIKVTGKLSEEHIRQLDVQSLDSYIINMLNNEVEEMKQVTGNTDLVSGYSSGNITAASAIAALQEAGSKGSRDINQSTYNCFTELCNLVLELIRQFYSEPRFFRITGEDGNEQFINYSNDHIQPQPMQIIGGDTGYRRPVFDIKVKAQRQSPFATVSQNELAKELYSMGLFNPELADQAVMCLDLMSFEGKETLISKIRENGGMYKQILQMQQQMAQMSAIIGQLTGTGIKVDRNDGNEKLQQNSTKNNGVHNSNTVTAGNARLDIAREQAQNMGAVK